MISFGRRAGPLLALTMLATGCGIAAEVDVQVRFESSSGELLDCQAVDVSLIEFTFVVSTAAASDADADTTEAPSRPHDRVRLHCPLGEQVLDIDPGRYEVTVRGFDASDVLCWEASQTLVLHADTRYDTNWVLSPVPDGEANGCVYP